MGLTTKNAGLALILAAAAQVAPSAARDLQPSEESAIGHAVGTIASANFCDFHVDVPALGRFIEGKTGPIAVEAEGVARVMLMVLAAEALQEDLLGTRSMSPNQKIAFCRQQIVAFGPTGRIAPGVLSTAEPPPK